jgi:ABC-type ATPase involved in cell division
LGKNEIIMPEYTISKSFGWNGKITDKVAAVMRMFGLTLDGLRERGAGHRCTVEINPGDIVYITGPSGSGKSVLLKELEGRFAAGERVNIDDIELPADKTVIDCMEGDLLGGLKMLSRAGLNDVFCVLNQPVNLSEGEKYRFQLGKAMASGRKCVFADEFCSNLDGVTAAVTAYNVRRFAKQAGVTFTGENETEMRRCSVSKNLEVVRGCMEDYERLCHFHYRERGQGGFTAIFAIRAAKSIAGGLGTKTVGVIAYRMPSPEVELRRVAMGGIFAGLDTPTQVGLVNKNVRCISRVIIEPRFRGLGLARRLVRETMPAMGVAVIEAMAVMGRVNPFLERAGMTAYAGKTPVRCVQLVEAFSLVGIEEEMFIDPPKVQERLESLGGREAEFIELQIRDFLDSYGDGRNKAAGLGRTRYVLSRLTSRPVYYIWFNPELAFSV